MQIRKKFPLGKAYGQAFCNRTQETQKLIGHINSGKHTFLFALRRYGKSSLCEHVFQQTDLPWAKVDFYLALSNHDVERMMLNAITNLIGQAIGPIDKWIHIIKNQVNKLKPKFVLGTEHLKLELSLSEDGNIAENIAEALLLLDKLLIEGDKKAVLVIDEFQEVAEMDNNSAIEGGIRHAAQETQNLAIIFSGSNRHLLRLMFEDEHRPLYKLCRKMVLDRIEICHYEPHIQAAAYELWEQRLTDSSFSAIMHLSQRHPYYVNYLCDTLCSNYADLPTPADVLYAWQQMLEEEHSYLVKDFSVLSHNQRTVMRHVAISGGKHLYTTASAKKMNMPINSISRAIASLIEKDYVEKTSEGFRLLIPTFQSFLIANSGEQKSAL